MRSFPIVTLIAAAMISVPLGTAQLAPSGSWGYAGSYEPDNAEDDPDFMWTSTPIGPDAKKRIYFNGFSVNSVGIVSLGTNVNSATLGTRMQPTGIETYSAILGNWVDCNADGYVGFGDIGLREYDAALLTDSTICPAVEGPAGEWTVGAHNYNGWVTELIPVGTDGGQFSSGAGNNLDDFDGDHLDDDNQNDARILRDTDAKVWGDYGRPGDIIEDGGNADTETCPIRPFPRGTLATTGGTIDYLDCHAALIDILNLAFDDELTFTPPEETGAEPVNVPGPGDPLGLRFTDEDDGRTSPLGQIQTLGSEDSSHAAVTLTDCSAEPIFDSSSTFNSTNEQAGRPLGEEDQEFVTDGTRTKVRPFAPAANTDPTSWTVPGQYNATNEETTWGGTADGSDCDTSNDDGKDIYGNFESDFEGTASTNDGKLLADFNMEFEDNGVLSQFPRGGIGLGLFGIPGVDRVDFPVHEGAGGMSVNNLRASNDWFARVALVKGPPTRSAVGPDEEPDYITYYASVGSTTLAAGYSTPGGNGIYGSAQCESFTSGVHGGWNCDPALWNLNGDGTPQPETQGGLARPGVTYNLRDVDCEDGGNNLGVATGAGLVGIPCAPFEG